jgi:hypothetical protein
MIILASEISTIADRGNAASLSARPIATIFPCERSRFAAVSRARHCRLVAGAERAFAR